MATAGAPGHFVARFGDSESAKCSISAVPSTSSRQSLQFFHHVSNSVPTSPSSTKKTKKENLAMYVYDIFTHSFETYIFVAEISAVFTVHEWLPRGLPSPCRNYWDAYFSSSSIARIGYEQTRLGHFPVEIRSITICIWNHTSPGKATGSIPFGHLRSSQIYIVSSINSWTRSCACDMGRLSYLQSLCQR